MIEITKPVLTFLNNLEKERTAAAMVRPLEQAIGSAPAMQVQAVTHPQAFVAPLPAPARSGPTMQKIQYNKPAAEVEKAKQLLRVRSFTAVGEKTFEYFMRHEAGEEG